MAKKTRARKLQDTSFPMEGIGLAQPAPSPSLPTDGELEAKWKHRVAVVNVAAPNLSDRMMRYRQTGTCPKEGCRARPVVCLMLRPGYAKFRCRVCGHIWEINRRPGVNNGF